MTDEPLTASEVRAALESEFRPSDEFVEALGSDWLRLQQRLAEVEREREAARGEANFKNVRMVYLENRLAEVERERDLKEAAITGWIQHVGDLVQKHKRAEAQRAEAWAALARIALAAIDKEDA